MEMALNSELVRELRNKANWSQEDLAAASGLSLRTIQSDLSAWSARTSYDKKVTGSMGTGRHGPRVSVRRFGLISGSRDPIGCHRPDRDRLRADSHETQEVVVFYAAAAYR